MNQRRFLTTVIAMSVSLIGLILLQVYWLRHDIRLKEQQFSQNVMLAMNSIVGKVEEAENQRIVIRHFITSGDTTFVSGLNTDSLLQSLSVPPIPPPPPPLPSQPAIPGSPEIGQVQRQLQLHIQKLRRPKSLERHEILVQQIDTTVDIRIERDIEQKEVFAIQLASEEARFDSLARETERRVASRMKKLNTMMQKFTFQITDRTSNVFNRVDTLILDSIIQNELKNHEINLPFSFGIVKPDQQKVMYAKAGSDISKIKLTNFRLTLFPSDIFKRNEELALVVNGKLNFILWSIWPLLLSSLVFTLAICIGFTYTMQVILKQKKLADIKNDFINNMTHEFKTPIATIAIANESIRDPRVNSDELKLEYYTSVIRDENKRMLSQVENVLQMAQIDKGELVLRKSEIDLADVLQRAVQSSELTVQQREGKIELLIGNEQLFVNADGNHLMNVFTNLIDNANKYSPELPVIKIVTAIENGEAVISIQDNGIGITKEVQKHIFETFYRATSGDRHDVKGFGLGLSYVKAIVEAHKGTVMVESELGKGSIFIVRLPLIS